MRRSFFHGVGSCLLSTRLRAEAFGSPQLSYSQQIYCICTGASLCCRLPQPKVCVSCVCCICVFSNLLGPLFFGAGLRLRLGGHGRERRWHSVAFAPGQQRRIVGATISGNKNTVESTRGATSLGWLTLPAVFFVFLERQQSNAPRPPPPSAPPAH